MTPIGEILRDEIARSGPVPFSRFMEAALYHPEHGYYMRPTADPFGREGDFFTAEQLQPVFGRLISATLRASLASPEAIVVELGAGRAEMAPFFADCRYIPIDVRGGALPGSFSGAVFGNEFLDALPVDVVVKRGQVLRNVLVTWRNDAFAWTEGGEACAEAHEFIGDAAGELAEGARLEVCLAAWRWIERLARSLRAGPVLFIDYGYTQREAVRFPEGTLMGYRRHRAHEDVLAAPGERDITAHVAFSAIEAHARRCGLEPARYESLAATLLRAGEPDQFASALAAAGERESLRLRMQLKTLLFGMGETFRTLLLRAAA